MSETLLVSNTYNLVVVELYRHIRPSLAKGTLIFGEILVVLLTVMAMYSTGSLIGAQCAWLYVADEDLINSLANPQVRFEAAFFIVQWLLALFCLLLAILNWLHEFRDNNITLVCFLSHHKWTELPISSAIANILRSRVTYSQPRHFPTGSFPCQR